MFDYCRRTRWKRLKVKNGGTNIKTERRTIQVEKSFYIAMDGKEFESFYACRKYENDLIREKAKEAFSTMRFFELTPDSADYGTSLVWVYLTSQQDYQTAITYLYDDDTLRHDIPEKYNGDFPCWVAFYTECYDDGDGEPDCTGEVIGSLDEIRKSVENYFEMVGEQMKKISAE